MKVSIKKSLWATLLLASVIIAYFFWLSLHPPEIVGVHRNGNHSYILVKNFPLTDKGRINWWLENKNRLDAMYNIPQPDADGFFTLIFWDFGEGYKKEGKYDRFCFDDMMPPINCIEKNKVLSVMNNRNKELYFTTNNKEYLMKKAGEIIRNDL